MVVHVHPVLECLLISECVIRESRRKRRLSPYTEFCMMIKQLDVGRILHDQPQMLTRDLLALLTFLLNYLEHEQISKLTVRTA